MSQKVVDRAAMQRATQQIDTKHQEITQVRTSLRGEMDGMKGSWHGNAANTFIQGYTQFDGEFEKVLNSLDKIHSSLVSTLQGYTQREDENQSVANQVAGLIG